MNKKNAFMINEFLVSAIFLVSFCLCTLIILYSISNSLNRRIKKIDTRHSLVDSEKIIVKEIKELLQNDCDSPNDFFWNMDKIKENDVIVELECISRKIPVLFLDSDLQQLILSNIFDEDAYLNYIDFIYKCQTENDFLKEKNIFDYLSQNEYVSHDILNEYFTEYGFFPFNLKSKNRERILRNIIKNCRINNPVLINKIISQNKECNSVDLKKLFGVYYNDLFPLISSYPLLNINFVPKEIILAVSKNQNFTNEVIKEREEKSIAEKKLVNLLNKYSLKDLNGLFGVKTNFFRITLKKNSEALEIVVMRDLETKTSFHIIKEKFNEI